MMDQYELILTLIMLMDKILSITSGLIHMKMDWMNCSWGCLLVCKDECRHFCHDDQECNSVRHIMIVVGIILGHEMPRNLC